MKLIGTIFGEVKPTKFEKKAMDDITVKEVFNNIRKMLR